MPPALLRNLNHSVSSNGSANSTSPVHRQGSCGDRCLRAAFIGTALPGSQCPISTREPKTKTSTFGHSGVRMTPNLNNIVRTGLRSLLQRCGFITVRKSCRSHEAKNRAAEDVTNVTLKRLFKSLIFTLVALRGKYLGDN